MGRREKPTRRQAKRAAREARLRRGVLIGSAVTVIAVAALIGYAAYNELVLIPNKVLATVNGEEITAEQFQKRVEFDFFFQGGAQQVQQGVTLDVFGQQTYDAMIEEIIVRQEAEERGITVTEAEIDEEAELAFGYDAGEPEPTRTPFPTPKPTLEPTETPTFVFTETPTLIPTIDPENTPTATLTAIPTVEGTLTATPTGTITPTPTPVTEQDYIDALDNFAETFSLTTSLSEEETLTIYRDRVANIIYRRKLLEALNVEVEKERTEVLAQHILVETENEANDILEMLDEGSDFGELAAKFSTDSTAYRGGTLGWFGEGRMVAPFEEAAFNAEVSEIVGPVETDFGFHIIRVNDRQDVPLNFFELQQAEQLEYQAFIQELRDEADINEREPWQDFLPEIPGVPTSGSQPLPGIQTVPQ